MGFIIAAIIGGTLFFWLLQVFKKFEHDASDKRIILFSIGLAVLALMIFIIPLFLPK